MCDELLSMEPDAKWPLLTQTRLQELLAQVAAQEGGGAASEAAVQDAYTRLGEVDALRRGLYADAAQGKAHVVAAPLAAKKK